MRTKGGSQRPQFISASEIGEYVYCARVWRLRRDGYEPTSGREALAAGTRWHTGHGLSVVRVQRLRMVSTVSLLLASMLVLVIILRWWLG